MKSTEVKSAPEKFTNDRLQSEKELGLDTKRVYWSDSENIEVLQNRGIVKQKGNTLFLELPEAEAISGMCEMKHKDVLKLVITTTSGSIYVYNHQNKTLSKLEKTIDPVFPPPV